MQSIEKQLAKTGPLVFVVVLNYTSLDDTLSCVECVRRSTYRNYRLLVIDNASPDQSGIALAEHIPSNELARLPRNIGYAGGNNYGIAKALKERANYVLVLNPDIRIPADGICKYVEIMESRPDIGILSPIQLKSINGPVDEKFDQSVLKPHDLISVDAVHGFTSSIVLDVSHVLGAVMMVRAESLIKIGGFDPLFFAYGEEEDFCRRARGRGFRIAVTNAAPAVHLRTNEKHPISSRILFLRTKGAYLLNLKDPNTSFLDATRRVFRSAIVDLLTLKRSRYPFSLYPVTRWHVFVSIIWIITHLPSIFLHRITEAATAPYLEDR